MKYFKIMALVLTALSFAACRAKDFYNETYAQEKQLTLGNVQKEVKKGMSQDIVTLALGSPNIVTQDSEGKETWIYDKIATEVRTSGTQGFILYCQTGADYVARKDISQRTLTVVIK